MLLRLLPLLRTHWRKLAGIGALVVVFAAGWTVNGWRYESQIEEERAARAEAVAEAVAKREAELIERLQGQRKATEAVSLRLSERIDELLTENADLLSDINTAPLVKPREVPCVDLDTGEEHASQPNPFSAEFVLLWNRAGGLRDD